MSTRTSITSPPSIFLLILPILGLLKINLVGDLFVGEPLVILCAIQILARGEWKLNIQELRPIFILGVIWLAAQIFTDVVVQTPVDDRLRGVAKISLFLVEIFVFDKLVRTQSDIIIFLIGYCISFLVRPFLDFGEDNNITDSSGFNLMWKFGIGWGIFLLASIPILIMAAQCPSERTFARRIALCALLLGFISFFFNARSLAAILIVTAIYLLLLALNSSLTRTRINLTLPTLGVILIAQAVSSLYIWGASSGTFGEEAKDKFESQYSVNSSASVLDVIGGGRSEFVASSEAIKDSPILGHGSWAKDYKYVELFWEARRRLADSNNLGIEELNLSDGLIPTHSHLFGAWVESGIFGATFWFWLMGLCLFKALPGAINMGGVIGTVTVMFLPFSIWNFLFSPFGGHVRLSTAFLIIIFAMAASHRPQVQRQ